VGPVSPATARYLVRFGYDGVGFAGWARQPGHRTVEGEIRSGLVRLGISEDADEAKLAVSSRTDRGVSARGNALALTSSLPPSALLRALNGISPEIWFTHLAEVPDGFRPRAASQRWYRYWERPAQQVPPAWAAASRAFSGRIDVRSFGRDVPAARPTHRDVDSVEPTVDDGWLVLDVRARSFVWGMVRKIVAALREVEAGALTVAELREAIAGERRLTLPLAEPDRLVLWETSYPIEWTVERLTRTAHQERHLRAAVLAAAARHEIRPRIHGGPARGEPAASPDRDS
jgi:tRNA pseudouridine38-40 synthase